MTNADGRDTGVGYAARSFAVIDPDGYIITPAEIARQLNSLQEFKENARNNLQAMREALEIEHQRALRAEQVNATLIEIAKKVAAWPHKPGEHPLVDLARVALAQAGVSE